MYKTIITIKDTVPAETMAKIQEIVPKAFNNRAGIVKNTSKLPNVFEFEGDNGSEACLDIGMFALKKVKGFLNCVQKWEWLEDDEFECCDMLEVFATPVR